MDRAYSHEFMMRLGMPKERPAISPELQALCDQMAEKLNAVGYAEASDALEYLGYFVRPSLYGDDDVAEDDSWPFQRNALESFHIGQIRQETAKVHSMIMDLASIENGEYDGVDVHRSLGQIDRLSLTISDSQCREYSIRISGNCFGIKVLIEGNQKGDGEPGRDGYYGESYVLHYESEIHNDNLEEKGVTEDEFQKHRGGRSYIELYHCREDPRWVLSPENAGCVNIQKQHLFGLVLLQAWRSNKHLFRTAWSQPEFKLDLFE